jgi:predicted nucleic acid-binding protein
MIVADSDVLIDALRGREPARSRIALEISSGGLATTAISAFELLAGAQALAEREKVDALLFSLRILPLTEEGSRAAATVHRDLADRGKPIGQADCLIAGICLARNALLLTRNRAHFERVPDLKLGTLTL